MLNQQQLQEIEAQKQDWKRGCLSTKRSNRLITEDLIREAYKIFGDQPPVRFLWFNSPLAMYVADLSYWSWFYDTTELQLNSKVFIANAAKVLVSSPMHQALFDGLEVAEGQRIENNIRLGIYEGLKPALTSATLDERQTIWFSIFCEINHGSHELYWFKMYLCYREIFGISYDEQTNTLLDAMLEISANCGWWIARNGICLISERPISYRKPAFSNRETITYADGFRVELEEVSDVKKTEIPI